MGSLTIINDGRIYILKIRTVVGGPIITNIIFPL